MSGERCGDFGTGDGRCCTLPTGHALMHECLNRFGDLVKWPNFAVPNPDPSPPMTKPEPHRPQSMSDAVEVAARAIAAEEPGCDIFPECVTAATETGCACRKDAANCLSAIGLPELLSEVERLRGVAEAGRRVTLRAAELRRHVKPSCPGAFREVWDASRDAEIAFNAALLASEDKT